MRTQKPTRALVGGAAVVALCAGTFAWGMHLSPGSHSGRDLYPALSGRQAAFAPGRAVTLTAALTHPNLVAAGSDDGPADDTTPDAMSDDSPGATFQQIYYLLKRNYVEGVPDDSKLGHGAAAAMIASLQDPNSVYYEPTDFAEVQRESKGQYAGIGAAFAVRTQITPKAEDDPTRDKDHPDNISYELTVVDPLPGSPAEKAGLQTGDVITDINGQWIATYDLVSAQAKELKAVQDQNDPVALNKLIDALQKKLDNALTLAQAETKLSDPNAKTLTLAVTRPGQTAPLTLTVEPATSVSIPAVESKSLDGGVGYIKINQFNDDTGATFDSSLAAFGNGVKGVILDLRDATGDSQEAAADVAAHLSTVTLLGYEQTKGNKLEAISVTPAKAVNGPVVVLVNGGTTGAAELLASALQSGGAKLIGSTTFGDDADVKQIGLRDGSGFTLTVGQFLTAAKTGFGSVGIKPDVAVPDAAGTDAPLSRAEMELSGRMARVP